jgi:NifU-like protein involved in Fe-S cluster formation
MSGSPKISAAALSQQAEKRLRQPLRRGRFQPIDAARAGLAPVSVADTTGQARVYYLVDADTHVIEDARFLAFGDLSSHPLADLFCERIRGQTLEAVADFDLQTLEADLRDRPNQPAMNEFDLRVGFLEEIKQGSYAAREHLEVPPPPVEVPRYERKRQQDWDERDQAWLPLSLLQKIAQATSATDTALQDRLNLAAGSAEITGLHDDFQVHLQLHAELGDNERATAGRFVEEALRGQLHPQITITLADDVTEAEA